jgi:hypothetical protein
MRINKNLLTLFSLGLCLYSAKAQNDLTSRHLNRLVQATETDVTLLSPYKTSFSIPIVGSLNSYHYNSAFRFNDLISDDNQIQPNLIIPKLKSMNSMGLGGQLDWFRMSKHIKGAQYTICISEVFSNRFDYSKDFIDLLWNGNASFAGRYADLNNVRIQSNYYRSISLGFTKKINEKWTMGVRPKLLFGLLNFSTKTAEASLYTDPNGFELSGNVKYDIYTSGYIEDTSNSSIAITAKDILGFKNIGLGLDAGVRYQLNEKISLSLNVKDFGYIKWKSKTANYHIDGYYKTTGMVITDSSSIVNANWEKSVDSLDKEFKPTIDREKYTTFLTSRISLSGDYKFNDWVSAYATLNTFIYYKLFTTLTVGSTFTLGRYFQGTINYSIMKNNYANFGFGIVLNAGPAQIFLITDNLPAIFNPYKFKYTNISLGINITLKPIKD